MNLNQHVKGNAVEVSGTTIDINELVSFLQSNTHITKLSLLHCNISDKDAEALANGNLAHLASLNLRWNRVGKKGIEALANGNLINLTELDLR